MEAFVARAAADANRAARAADANRAVKAARAAKAAENRAQRSAARRREREADPAAEAAAAAQELAFRALKTHLVQGSLNRDQWRTHQHTIGSIDNVTTAARLTMAAKNSVAENKALIARGKAYANYAARAQQRAKNIAGQNDENPLAHAIRTHNHDAVYDLLSNKGHILGNASQYPYPPRHNVHVNDKILPLHVAAWSAHDDRGTIMNLLLAKGVGDVTATDTMGQTALHIAVISRNPIPRVKALLKAGANVNAHDGYGNTPLHNVAISKDPVCVDVARLLLEAGANINARNFNGRTPLQYAASWSNPTCMMIARLLLEHGADARAVDDIGYKASKLAKYDQLKHLLLEAEARQN